MSFLDKADLNLLQYALAQGWLQQSDVVSTLNTHKARYEAQQKYHTGFLHQISGQGKLTLDGETHSFHCTPMLYRARDWKPWGTHHLLLDSEGLPLESIAPPETDRKTLLQWIHPDASPGQSCVFDPDFSHQLWWGPQSHFWFPEHTQHPLPNGPTDILTADAHYFFLADRSKGEIRVYTHAEGKPECIDVLTIREQPSTLALSMVFDGQQLHINSQLNSTLISYNPQTQQSEKRELGLGPLGNMRYLSNHPNHLALIVRKPHPALVLLDLAQDELHDPIALPGDLYTNKDAAPIDLMAFHGERNHLVILNVDSDSARQTPQLLQIHPFESQPIARHALPHHPLPDSLSFARMNPAFALRDVSIWELLIEAGLLSPERYNALQAEFEQFNQTRESLNSDPAQDMEQDAAPTHSSHASHSAHLTDSHHVTDSTRPASPAGPADPTDPADSNRPSKTARQVQSAPAPCPNPHLTAAPPKPPDHCPLCDHRLMGLWDCPVCGYAVINPIRQSHRAIASYQVNHGLPPGHFILPDPERHRVLILDHHHQVQREIDITAPFVLHLGHHEDGDFLCCDPRDHALWRTDSKGNPVWHWQNTLENAPPLQRPTLATALHFADHRGYLIVDRGNQRVLVSNEAQDIHLELKAPLGELQLGDPVHAQFTPQQHYLVTFEHGLVSYNTAGQPQHHYRQDDYHWETLCFAEALDNGDLWVVDAGKHEFMALDAHGVIQQRFFYVRSHFPPHMQLKTPQFLSRLATGELLLSDGELVIELLIAQKQLRWHSALKDLKLRSTPSATQSATHAAQPNTRKAPSQATEAPKAPHAAKPALKAPLPKPKMGFQVPRKQVVENRVNALLNKQVNVPHKESYSPSIVYSSPEATLERRSFYLLDHKNNSVLRLNRKGKITWHYGFDLGQQLLRPAYCRPERHSVWVADTQNNRVIEIGIADKEIYQEIKGPADRPLRAPRCVDLTEHGFLIADQRNRRLVEVGKFASGDERLYWYFDDPRWISTPHSAFVLNNGNILFADAYLNHVVEINRDKKVVWRYKQGLFSPMFARRLDNGNTLIADTHHHRVIEVTPDKQIVWEYIGHAKSNRLNPTHVERLENGNTLITYFNHSKLVELTPDKKCVWSYTLGKDLFQAPVIGDEEIHVRQEAKALHPFYNPVEKRQLLQALEQGNQVLEIQIRCLDHIQMKSVRAQLILLRLEAFGLVIKSFPSPEDLLAGQWGRELILTTKVASGTAISAIQETLGNIAEVSGVKINALKPQDLMR